MVPLLRIQTETETKIIQVQEKTSPEDQTIMQVTISKHQGTHFTCFSPMCINVMDFFLQNVNLYFTPLTVSLSMEKQQHSVKACMNLLKRASYLSKISDNGTVYHITKENMGFYHADFKNHVLALEKLRQR